ncbi:MAG: UDP-N-acetylmuramoyl-tripeptide--D-alanyl-D-alanine ligase [Bryobacterales bacterium]|nr:UDP-N-acetylmuramoyl-tripeptide--D-alanyl-D-alanine ligase [Bryobacterales bacterium]
MTTTLAAALALACAAAVACVRAVRALHMWQMDSYIVPRYLQWLFAKPLERYVDLIGLAACAAATVLPVPFGWALIAVACGVLYFRKDTTPVKKPLDYTARAKRTLLAARVIIGLAAVLLFLSPVPVWLGAALLLHSAPWAILAANVAMKPVQAHINRGFVKQAAAKLAQLKPLVIGVAGSYGKTSTKYYIDVLLAEKHNVIKSPGNFNTLLGITRVVNDMLKPEHKVFIAEMGAYQRGEVKEIADLVHPKIGIITSIGPEHFERFLTMENIENTNYELSEGLPADGLAVFNGDNEHCRKLAARTKHTRVALYSLENASGEADLWARDVTHTREGLQFTIALRDGRTVAVKTQIVGRHNVLNILGATRIALEMGLTLDECAAGIAKLKPAPNRLEVKPGAGGTTIIDDSYNSNPVGAAEALYVLSQFTGGKRILVTPGMIELGTLHYEKNEELGFIAAKCADYVILVGPDQTKPIQDGLRRGGFPEESLRIIKDLSETQTIFPKLLRSGDVLLFENDLPDLYSEK